MTKKIPSVYAKEGMTIFHFFLNENSQKYIVPIANDGHVFDDKHLIRARNRTGLTDDFKWFFAGFSDTLAFCKKYHGISHKPSDLFVGIVRGTYQAQGASDDAVALA